MSKLFGPSMRNIASNAGLLLEDSEKVSIRNHNVDVQENNTEIFARSSVPTSINCRNISSRLGLLNSKIEEFEDLSKIEIDGNVNEYVNAPSTSSVTSQHLQLSSSFNPCLNKFNRIDTEGGPFYPSPRKTLHSLRLHYKSHGNNFGVSNNNSCNIRKWDMTSRNYMFNTASNSTFLQNKDSGTNNDQLVRKLDLVQRSHNPHLGMYRQNTSNMNSTLFFKDKTAFSKGAYLQSEEAVMYHPSSMTNLSIRNNDINIPTGSKRNSALIRQDSAWERMKTNNKPKVDDGVFLRPSISKIFKPKTSLTRNNTEMHNAGLNASNRFNVTHIPKREMDYFTCDSQLHSKMRDNQIENKSVTGGSVISVDSAFNILECLHHSLLNISSNLPVEVIRKKIEEAKEMVENRSEMSFAPTIKDMDAASLVSHSSKYICPVLSENQSEEKIGPMLSLKSGKDILNTLVSKNQNNCLPPIDEERKSTYCTSHKQLSDDEKDDSALLFKRPKPFYKHRKKNCATLNLKTPKVQKNFVSKVDKIKSDKIINLKHWYPVAKGSELTFCGTLENGIHSETEAVKKRMTNRKILLINGCECNLIGTPSEIEVSILSTKMKSALKDGLTSHWRVFQKELLNYQMSNKKIKLVEKGNKSSRLQKTFEEENCNYDTTPKARKSPLKRNTQKKNHRVSLRIATKRTNIKSTSKTGQKDSRDKENNKPTAQCRMSLLEVKSPQNVTTSSKLLPRRKKNNVENFTPEIERQSLDETNTSDGGKNYSKEKTQINKKTYKPNKIVTRNRGNSPQKKSTPNLSNKSKRNPPKILSTCLKKGRSTKPCPDLNLSKNEVTSTSIETPQIPHVKSAKRSSKRKSSSATKSPTTKNNCNESQENVNVHSSTKDKKQELRVRQLNAKRKREISGEVDHVQRKKSKSEETEETLVNSTADACRKPNENKKQSKSFSSTITKEKAVAPKYKRKNNKKNTVSNKNLSEVKSTTEISNFEDDCELQLDDINIPEVANTSGKLNLNRSQLRTISMETPPLKYFNTKLKLLKNCTPIQSPDWCISQRTASEVKEFQKRRALAHKKKITVEKNLVSKDSNLPKGRDLKNVLDWVAEKTIRTPTGSKILQFMIPSRKRILLEGNEEHEDEDEDNELFED